MMEQQQRQGEQGVSSSIMGSLSVAQAVTTTPFTGKEAAFESEIIREEYGKLCRDHSSLIKLGESFGTFDPMGKLAFLDQLEGVESRWDVFFSRFSLLGALDPAFKEQTDGFLSSMGMSVESFRKVLKEAHDLMRLDAEQERMNQPM
uniref:Uncharacterized protein n=1 Tax=Haptolina brevifila TaxID=156173 RepID=A0A7S2BEG5_9EUKA